MSDGATGPRKKLRFDGLGMYGEKDLFEEGNEMMLF